MSTVNVTVKKLCVKELWRAVVGWEGYYEVSTWGRVRSLDRTVPMCDGRNYRTRGKVLNSTQNGYYFHVTFCRSGKETTALIHRLVLETFVGPCPDGMECRHLDGDSTNNRLDNLCWGTPQENARDRVNHGTNVPFKSGSEHPRTNALLNDKKVRRIRRLWKQGVPVKTMAQMFGTKNDAIRGVINGRTWKHVV